MAVLENPIAVYFGADHHLLDRIIGKNRLGAGRGKPFTAWFNKIFFFTFWLFQFKLMKINSYHSEKNFF